MGMFCSMLNTAVRIITGGIPFSLLVELVYSGFFGSE